MRQMDQRVPRVEIIDVPGFILVHVRTQPSFEFEELVSRKSLDSAIRGDSFASEPYKKVTAPIRWRNTG
jgi:hypothetical protein